MAALALGLSLWEGYNARRHNRLSVRPQLTFGVSLNHRGKLRLYLTNTGLGPATNVRVRAGLDGSEPQAMGYGEFLKLLHSAGIAEPNMTNAFPAANTMRSGEECELVGVVPNFASLDGFVDGVARLCLIIEYESMYGEPFSSSTEGVQQAMKEAQEMRPAARLSGAGSATREKC